MYILAIYYLLTVSAVLVSLCCYCSCARDMFTLINLLTANGGQ